jgi:hypothetical protein
MILNSIYRWGDGGRIMSPMNHAMAMPDGTMKAQEVMEIP